MKRGMSADEARRIADKYISADGARPGPAPDDDAEPVDDDDDLAPEPEPEPDPSPGDDGTKDEGGINLLRSIVERIQRLDDERLTIVSDIKEVYGEAKGHGFDPAVLRKIVSDLRKDPAKLQEFQSIYDVYMHALGKGPAVEARPTEKTQNSTIYDDLKSIQQSLKATRMARGVSAPFSTHISQAQWIALQQDFARRFPKRMAQGPITLADAARHFEFQQLTVKG